ncbi:response regulator [Massilia sp. YIM B02769]|uniref:ATP-binding protein n=1 Tax=Massilia sp. YIM B02769 TaxID=3050129 RepID=UPI0025B6842C|nr:ATP-binding protein [Massilia sp. YIM B02769]MDN4058830.1 response regulator [Massilia sp. YIM B02769]
MILVVAILVPSFIGAALAVAYVYVEQQKDQERSIAETGRAFALLIDNEMRHQEGILRTLAASPALAAGDFGEFYQHARRAAGAVDAVAVLYDLDGKPILNTRRPLGVALTGRDPSNLPALMERFGAARTLVSDVFYAPPVQRYDFMMQVPVLVDGEPRYHLVLGLHVGILQQLLERQDFPKAWIATVFDRNGRIAARSSDPRHYVGTLLREKTRKLAATTDRDLVFPSHTLTGVPVRAQITTVPNSGWKVLIAIPSAEIRRVPLEAAALLAGMMAVLLVLAIAAGRWFASRAVAPIEYLGRCADRLADGEEIPYRPHGLEEIDTVAWRMVEASKQIRRSKRDLEHRVNEAILATEQAQGALLRGQKLESLGRLTAGIAHEFNNLLQTLTTALQLAAMQAKEPNLQRLIDTCKRTVTRATTLTGQLGSFGRVQEGRLVTVDTAAQLGSALQLIRGAVADSVEIETGFAPALWPVRVEPLQFDLALLNLAINARDAMGGSGRLAIAARNATLDHPPEGLPSGDYLLLTVQDEGAGMAPEVLARALDPFFTTKSPGQGTGLGLPQAYAFATQAQGLLTLHSTPGKGTRVQIYLPRAQEDELAAPAAAAETVPSVQGIAPDVVAPAPVQSPAAGVTVLFVEDDVLVREAVVEALAAAGFAVRVAENGEAALVELERDHAIDIVFSDIVMPGSVSGIDLAGAVSERWPTLPVVLATGYTDRRVSIPGVKILAKPYDVEQLIGLLGRLSGRR